MKNGVTLKRCRPSSRHKPSICANISGTSNVDAKATSLTLPNCSGGKAAFPASNTKIVVAAVASALLPPEWTVRTSLYADGPVANGIVHAFGLLKERGDEISHPLVVRLDGNNAEEGRRILTDAALPLLEQVDTMDGAAARAAELAAQ